MNYSTKSLYNIDFFRKRILEKKYFDPDLLIFGTMRSCNLEISFDTIFGLRRRFNLDFEQMMD